MKFRLLRTLPVVLLLTFSILPISILKADSNTISLHISQFDRAQIIDIPSGKSIASLQVETSRSIYTPKSPPNFTLFTTDTGESETNVTDPVYYDQYTAEVLKEGLTKHLYLYAPSTYYRGGYEIQTYSLDLQVNLVNEPFFPMVIPQTTYEYIVITTGTLWSTLNQNFKQWKIDSDSKISNILITNVSDIINIPQCWVNGTYGDATDNAHGNHWVETGKAITSQYSMFNDTQAKIRNYIRYCYDNYGTRYVLLAGNKNLVPPRIMFTTSHSGPGGSWYNYTHAVDMYYSCLDGNWNNNTNSLWGENKLDFPWCKTPVWDNIDWGYDVTLGRILADTVGETNAWITRLKEYVDGNAYSKGNYLQNIIIAGKSPSNVIDPYVWNQLNDEFPFNVSFVNNYTITQPQWSVMDDYCNGAIAPYDGIHILYHSGHGGTETPYLSANLNNSDRPQGLFYTEGCQTADFGASTTTRTENLFANSGGFVCDISNSAYGWFEASTWYSETMFSLMFNISDERCYAKAHDEARELFGHTAHSVCPQLVKGTIFFGDPALEYNWYNPEPLNYPPTITNPQPINGSIGQNTSLLWTVDIADHEGQNMNWAIACSNGQSASGSSYNDTVYVLISNLGYSTTYTVWVNVTDGENPVSKWFSFSTKTPPSMSPENGSHYESVYGLYMNYTPMDNGNVSFYWGDDTFIHAVTNVTAGGTASVYVPDYQDPDWLAHDTTYNWYVIHNGTMTPDFNFETSKAWDLNEDLSVNYLDASSFVSHYSDRVTPAGKDSWDINEDTYTNYLDLSSLVSHYGEEYL
jgi:hypothetical protein